MKEYIFNNQHQLKLSLWQKILLFFVKEHEVISTTPGLEGFILRTKYKRINDIFVITYFKIEKEKQQC